MCQPACGAQKVRIPLPSPPAYAGQYQPVRFLPDRTADQLEDEMNSGRSAGD